MPVYEHTLEIDLRDFHQHAKKVKQLAEVLEEERELDSLAAKYGGTEIFVREYARVKAQIAKLKLELSVSSSPDVIVISDDESDADDGEDDDAEEDEDCMELILSRFPVEFEPIQTRASTRARRRVSPSPSEYLESPVDSNALNQDPKHTRGRKRMIPKLTVEQLKDISDWKVNNGSAKFNWKEVAQTVPSVQGIRHDRIRRAFDTQSYCTLKKGEPWSY